MKVVQYNGFQGSEQTVNYFRFLEPRVKDKLIQKYLNSNEKEYSLTAYSTLFLQLNAILSLTSDGILEKRILDLGCGSIHNQDHFKYPQGFEPWLCRFLHEAGAKPIGIDIANLDNEEFEHYQLDLGEPNSLDFLADNSIDIAHSSLLFDSPTMVREMYERNPGIEIQNPATRLKQNLLPQLEKIIKPEGFFIYQ